MIVLQVNKLDKYFGADQVLKGVSLTINQNDRVGIVGPNGAGKTTLLRCLTGELEPDAGDIILTNGIKIGYLSQLPEEGNQVTAWEAVMASFSDLLMLRRELRELEEQMSQPGADLDRLYTRYSRVTHQYELENGYACEAMARRVLAGLGIPSEQFDRPWHSFSGGEKTRINLARLLVRTPDLLLLDEPTNHLDLEAVEWLESFLVSYAGTLVVVSHDRRFLDQVANRIIEVNHQQIRVFPGNYTNYLKVKAEQDLAAQRAYEKQQEYIRRTQEYIARYRAGIKAKQARGRQSQLNRLERLDAVKQDSQVSLKAASSDVTSGEMVLEVQELEFFYGDNRLFTGVSLLLRRGERVALIGRNGAGKTTLLKLLTGELTATAGSIRWGSRVKWAYLSQHNEFLNPGHSVLEALLTATDFTVEQARTRLAGIGFTGDEVNKMVSILSGGERMRLALLQLLAGKPNLLILDEPTNHLDIASREVVEALLDEFEGTLLLVSHDRYLLDRVADKIIELKEGRVQVYHGNYSYYRERKAEEKLEAEARPVKVNPISAERQQQKEEQQLKRRLLKELAVIEADIEVGEARKAELEAALADPTVYADEELALDLNNQYRECSLQLEEMYLRWEALQEQVLENSH